MAVCCQNLTLGALSSRSALSVLVDALFKKFGLFLNTPHIDQYETPSKQNSTSAADSLFTLLVHSLFLDEESVQFGGLVLRYRTFRSSYLGHNMGYPLF
jgi:hypothetical protein